jgi:hypothetical protein
MATRPATTHELIGLQQGLGEMTPESWQPWMNAGIEIGRRLTASRPLPGGVWLSTGNRRYPAEHIPGAQLLELRGVDHDAWVGDTEPALQAVEAFLATIQPTAAQAGFVAQNR